VRSYLLTSSVVRLPRWTRGTAMVSGTGSER
jgi:hypothetical protein